jgi:IS605 OrfB family transposase
MKSLKIKLKLDFHQELVLNTLSNEHRLVYNKCLEQAKEKCDFMLINEAYKNFRNENQLTINSKSAQNTSRMLINNVKSFFSLHKKDKASKFPYKFKSHKYFCSFTLDNNNGNGGFKLYDNAIELNLCNRKQKLLISLSEDLLHKFQVNSNTIKTIAFKKENDNYFLICTYAEKPQKLQLNKKNFISLDLGISNLFALASNKIESEIMLNSKFNNLQRQTETVQSILDHKKKFSKKWKNLNKRFLRLKRKLANKNKDFQHKVSNNLIEKCKENNIGTLIVGDINTKKVINKKNYKLKSTSKNFGLSRFKTFLSFKAQDAGIDFHKVNEAYSSQTNCLTRQRFKEKVELSQREVELKDNMKIDRDLNSAINIAQKIMGQWLPHFKNFVLAKIYMNSQSQEFVYEKILYNFV